VTTNAARYSSIQIARAFAALAVLVTHSQVLPEVLGAHLYTHGLWSFGQAGVDIFFVISGFIISAVLQKPQTVAQFAARRSFRILPFYWLFTLVSALILTFGYLTPPSVPALAASYVVLPGDAQPVLGVGWSLEHELIFYAIVSLLIWRGRADALFGVMAVLSAISIAVHLVMPSVVDGGIAGHLLSLYHLQFFAGVALFRWQNRIVARPWLPMLVCGLLMLPVAAAMLHLLYNSSVPQQPIGWIGLLRVTLWGSAGMMIIGGLLACETQRADLMQSAQAKALVLIGGASYALYLSHPVVIELLGFGLQGVWPSGSAPWLASVVAIAGALGFALIFYRWVEEPAIIKLTRLADAISRRKAPEPSGTVSTMPGAGITP
jgi:exopolysaccharide production protein ExoZ